MSEEPDFWEVTDQENCPHGYSMGDHHWFKCMGVSPFEDEDYPEVEGEK